MHDHNEDFQAALLNWKPPGRQVSAQWRTWAIAGWLTVLALMVAHGCSAPKTLLTGGIVSSGDPSRPTSLAFPPVDLLQSYQKEASRPATLPAVGKASEPPEGPGRAGNKPLMRNLAANESQPRQVIAGNTLPARMAEGMEAKPDGIHGRILVRRF